MKRIDFVEYERQNNGHGPDEEVSRAVEIRDMDKTDAELTLEAYLLLKDKTESESRIADVMRLSRLIVGMQNPTETIDISPLIGS